MAFSTWYRKANPLWNKIISVHKTTSITLFCDFICEKKWKWTIPLFVLVDNTAVCNCHWATNIGSKYLERVLLVFWFTNLTETFPDTGRCHMIYWCFLMVCHLSFSLNFALCEHYICKHSIYMHPPSLSKHSRSSLGHSNWLVTSWCS